MKLRTSSLRTISTGLALGSVVALLLASPAIVRAAGEEQFDSPQAAVDALTQAAKTGNVDAIHTIFGPEGHDLVSPDSVQASNNLQRFEQRVSEKTHLVEIAENKNVLEIGNDGYPFAIPLVKENGKWFFDVAAGREEILNRRIGANELGAIGVCHAYVDAQREYASRDRSNNGVLEYAQRLRSTPGSHDGLYWPVKNPNEELSPFGPLISEAREEGYRAHTGMMKEAQEQSPYHGYYFKILKHQGSHAPAGRYDYVINGHMIAGFALVAWPAEYGNTGIMTFIVNQNGKVYQKDLGTKTDAIGRKMTSYDPDNSWKPVTK